jgi:hypothetical protein
MQSALTKLREFEMSHSSEIEERLQFYRKQQSEGMITYAELKRKLGLLIDYLIVFSSLIMI